MITLPSGRHRLAKYGFLLLGLVPVAFGISFALGKFAPETAEAEFGEAPSQPAPRQAGGAVGTSASRVALIIGNADYPDASAPLSHPLSDAYTLAGALRRSGFAVEVRENLSKDEMTDALESFNARIEPGSVALISYIGFGIQSGRESYMIPVNAQIWKEPDVRRDGVSIESALAGMHRKGAGVKLAILDASRRNPYERRFRGYSGGLAAIDAPPGTLLLSAAAPGKVAYDVQGNQGRLISELVKEIEAPGVSAEVAFNHTRIGVSRTSEGEQVPLVSSSLIDSFTFVAAPPRYARTRPVEPVEVPVKATPRPQDDDAAVGQRNDQPEVASRATPRPQDDGATGQLTDAVVKPVNTAPRPRIVETKAEASVSPVTPSPARAEPTSRPVERPVAKDKKAKAVEEAKRPRRSFDDVRREIDDEHPRQIIRRGWLSSLDEGRGWRNGGARRIFTRALFGGD